MMNLYSFLHISTHGLGDNFNYRVPERNYSKVWDKVTFPSQPFYVEFVDADSDSVLFYERQLKVFNIRSRSVPILFGGIVSPSMVDFLSERGLAYRPSSGCHLIKMLNNEYGAYDTKYRVLLHPGKLSEIDGA